MMSNLWKQISAFPAIIYPATSNTMVPNARKTDNCHFAWKDYDLFFGSFSYIFATLSEFIIPVFFGHFNPSSFFLIFLFWAIYLEYHEEYCLAVQSKKYFLTPLHVL